MLEISELSQRRDLFDEAVEVFWKQWGNQQNYKFYQDCMLHSCHTTDEIPRLYLALLNGSIFGTYALIRNDLNNRQDLFPWLACLYVNPEYRGSKLDPTFLNMPFKRRIEKDIRNFI